MSAKIAQSGILLAVTKNPLHRTDPIFSGDALEGPGLQLAARLDGEEKTAVAIIREKTPLGLIAMRDEPRADAAEAVAQLERLGVSSLILAGDKRRNRW